MAIPQPNQLHRELLSICGINPFDGNDSSSRKQMVATQLGQIPVSNGTTERYIQTGVERELGKFTFSVKAPTDIEVIKIIERYRRTMGSDSITENPQTIVIYEDVRTKEVGMMDFARFASYHQHFGFPFKPSKDLQNLRVGATFPKNTVFLNSPAVTENGGYKYGRECNVAFMTHPAVSEDGILISSDVLQHFKIKTYERRIVEFGKEYFPLNLYGTVDNFKAFPDIGEVIRTDGLLMGLRKHEKNLVPIEQNIYDLMEVDFNFDKRVYADGAGGRIIDVKVHHDDRNNNQSTPAGMETQAEKYYHATRSFYQEIVTEYNRYKRQRGENLRLTPEFHRLVVEAIAYIDEGEQYVIKTSGKKPLDEWRIEFVIEYEITPTIGFKLSDTHGGKGVICKICRPEDMPVDADGNRADIVMDPNGTVNRMNLGRSYEQFINGTSRDLLKRIKAQLGNKPIEATDPALVEGAFNQLAEYYQDVSARMGKWFENGLYPGSKLEHVKHVFKNNIHLYRPPEDELEIKEVSIKLNKKYPSTYGPVTYVGNSGRRVTTKYPVRIASMYIIILEKTAEDWTAVSSGVLQHFGVLAPLPKARRYSNPSRVNPIRPLGEAEVRIDASYAGPKVTTDMVDRNNSVMAHEAVVESILSARQPSNIASAVDRSVVKYGNSRPLQIIKHILSCMGVRFSYHKSP